MDRRQFLARSAALAAAASVPATSFADETMRTRPIPGTNEELPVIGLGAPRPFIELPPDEKQDLLETFNLPDSHLSAGSAANAPVDEIRMMDRVAAATRALLVMNGPLVG